MLDNSKGNKPNNDRIKFEQTDTTNCVVENEYCKIYNDTKSGKTFKVINNEVVPIELRELNMWKNRQKNPANFTVDVIKDNNGGIYDYVISRVSSNSTATPAPSAPVSAPIAPTASPIIKSAPVPPLATTSPIQSAVSQTAVAKLTNVQPAAPSPAVTTVTANASEISRIKFEMTETTSCVIENEFCKIYKDSKSGKTFKVINGEVAPIELRELNMWKNRQKNPQNFNVEIVKNKNGNVHDYVITRISSNNSADATPVAPVTATPTTTPAPVAKVAPTQPVYTPAVQTPTVQVQPAPSAPAKPAVQPSVAQPAVSAPKAQSAVTTSVNKAAVNDRIKFEETESTVCVIETEFCKIYRDSRAGKTFKVINGMVAPIELRELNMWKNRQKNPRNFSVEIVKDASGADFDYVITRVGSGTASTSADTETPSAPTAQDASNRVASVVRTPMNDTIRTESTSKKRKPKSTRLCKCAICGNEYSDSDLFLFGNRNFCVNCIEDCVKERVQGFPVDPVEKAILDVTTADELYCTYSTVTNYPYLDDEFCVNVCTVSRAAESVVEDTAVETIDDKGVFFDDLKRFGLKKIIVNNDSGHIFSPHDFDEHVKTECVLAPKLYFKILNFLQNGDEELREKIAPVFLGSKLYTFGLTDDIVKITEENLDEFKPLTVSDGYVNFCPVFTDVTEARSVGMPFKGLYEIDAALIPDNGITHYIVNPASLAFIINKTTLEGVEPKIEEETAEEAVKEEVVAEIPAEENVTEEPVAEISAEETVTEEPIAEIPAEETATEEVVADIPAEETVTEEVVAEIPTEETVTEEVVAEIPTEETVTKEVVAEIPIEEIVTEEPVTDIPAEETVTEEPVAEISAEENVTEEVIAEIPTEETVTEEVIAEIPTEETVTEEVVAEIPAEENVTEEVVAEISAEENVTEEVIAEIPTAETVTEEIIAEIPAEETVTEEPVTEIPAEENVTEEVVVEIPAEETVTEEPVAEIPAEETVTEEAVAQSPFDDDLMPFKPATEEKSVDDSLIEEATAEVIAEKSIDDIVNDLADENDFNTSLDLSNLMLDEMTESKPKHVYKVSIQQQITETKVIARDLEIEGDFSVAQILRDKLNESYKNLAKLIVTADKMYAQFDAHTKHILIDGFNRGHIFSEKAIAEMSVESFRQNGIEVYIKEYNNDELFTMLYEYKRHGIQDLVLDESANWIVISTDTISDMLDVSDSEYVSIPVTNPELMFSMTTLFQKLQSKTENPNRKAEIASCERRMIREFTSARYILPLLAYDRDNMHPITVDNKNGVKRVLVFSDVFEMKRFFGNKFDIVQDYKILSYDDMIREFAAQENTVVVLNEGSLRFEFNEHNCEHINRVINK